MKVIHECRFLLPDDACGPAITYCTEEASGGMWVGNGEYESQVAYCPYCGKKAEIQPAMEDWPEHWTKNEQS